MTVADIKAYLHIDSDLTDDDATLGELIEAAQESVESETGKAYDDTKALMRDYVRLFVKQRYENNGEAVLEKAIYSLRYHIMRSSDFAEIPEKGTETDGTSNGETSTDTTTSETTQTDGTAKETDGTSSDGSEESTSTDGGDAKNVKTEDGGANDLIGGSDGT